MKGRKIMILSIVLRCCNKSFFLNIIQNKNNSNFILSLNKNVPNVRIWVVKKLVYILASFNTSNILSVILIIIIIIIIIIVKEFVGILSFTLSICIQLNRYYGVMNDSDDYETTWNKRFEKWPTMWAGLEPGNVYHRHVLLLRLSEYTSFSTSARLLSLFVVHFTSFLCSVIRAFRTVDFNVFL